MTLKLRIDEDGYRRLDVENLESCKLMDIRPSNQVRWEYNDEKGAAYAVITVYFNLDQTPHNKHFLSVAYYPDEGIYKGYGMQINYQDGWIDDEFYYSKKDIEKSNILKAFVQELENKSRIPFLTTVQLPSIPSFCPSCKEDVMHVNHEKCCMDWTLRRVYGYTAGVSSTGVHSFEEMERKLQEKLKYDIDSEERFQFLTEHLSKKQKENLERLIFPII